MPRYRKKSVIEAEQFFPDDKPWPEGVEQCDNGTFRIKTLEGYLKVSASDQIITGIRGERYPCRIDIFDDTYEIFVEGPTDTELLDWLDANTKGYGGGWVCRNSITGRGMRLHEMETKGAQEFIGEDPQPTVRQAIAAAMKRGY